MGALVGAALCLWSVAAAAAPTACAGPELLLAGEPASSWTNAIAALQTRLREGRDLDRCAHLVLEPVSEAMVLTVVTEDHRSARRRVARPSELLQTVEGLLVVPVASPEPPPAAEPPQEPVASSTAQPAAPEPLPAPPAAVPEDSIRFAPMPPLPDAPSSVATQHPVGFEIGGGGAGRVAGSPMYFGAGAAGFAQVVIERWLLGASMRWELVNRTLRDEIMPAGFGMHTYAIGVGVGRRVPVGRLSLDLAAGPEVVAETQEMNALSGNGMDGRNESDVRVSGLVRLSIPQEGKAYIFAAADVEGSVSKLTSASPSDGGYPPLPGWSSGLSLGVAWGAH
jgi:hypothetical protein